MNQETNESVMADPVEGAATAAEALTGDTGTTTEVQRKRAEPANFLAIVRGRFPLMLVHAVRFDEVLSKMTNKDVAAKLATSVGKVFDIRKNRNFAYLTKSWKPTASDVADAKAWAEQIGGTNAKGLIAAGDKALVTKIVESYEAAGLATAAEAEAFAASKPKSNFGTGGVAKSAGEAVALPASTETKAAEADDLLG